MFVVGIGADHARVTVSAGQARVRGAKGRALALGPAEQAVYLRGERVAMLGKVDPEMAFVWRNGRIIFDGPPL